MDSNDTGQFIRTYPENVALGIFLGFVTVITIVGNLLVILAVILVKKLRTASNFLILSLALSDLLVGVLVIPISSVREVQTTWIMGEALCDIFISFDVLMCTASILNLCAISIDRYLAITRPLQYAARRTPKRMFLMITGVWMVSALISITPLFGFKEPYKPGECGYSDNIIYQIYATCGAFYIPLAVMLVLYGRIFILARRMAQEEAKQKRVAESVCYQHDRRQSSYNPLDQSLNNDYKPTPKPEDDQETRPMLKMHNSNRRLSRRLSRARRTESGILTDKYPLPPSEICRRRKPRMIYKTQSYSHLSELQNRTVYGKPEATSRSQLSCTDEFHEHVKHLRQLRAEFFAAPPSRHCSSIILNTRPRGSSLVEPLIRTTDQSNTANGLSMKPNGIAPHRPLHISQSMRVDSRTDSDTSTNFTLFKVRGSVQISPPILSVTEYTEDTVRPKEHSFTLSDSEERIQELEVEQNTAIVRGNEDDFKPSRKNRFSRIKERKMVSGRRSYSNAINKPARSSSERIDSFARLRNLIDRRKSSPANTSYWNLSPNDSSKLPGTDINSRRLITLDSDGAISHNRSRNPSWASIKIPLRKRKSKGHSDSKAIKTLGVIMGCFCLCWIPFFIIALARPLHKVVTKKELEIRKEVESLFLWLGYVNSTINPIIYAIFNREFRIPFKEILLCRCRGINARLRSQRYATEMGHGGTTTASMLGLATPNIHPSDNGGLMIAISSDSNATPKPIYRPHQSRMRTDSWMNHSSMANNRMTVQPLDLPVGTLGRRASMFTNRRF